MYVIHFRLVHTTWIDNYLVHTLTRANTSIEWVIYIRLVHTTQFDNYLVHTLTPADTSTEYVIHLRLVHTTQFDNYLVHTLTPADTSTEYVIHLRLVHIMWCDVTLFTDSYRHKCRVYHLLKATSHYVMWHYLVHTLTLTNTSTEYVIHLRLVHTTWCDTLTS